MDFNLANLVETVAELAPDRLAVIFRDQRLTYADLVGRSRRLANLLLDAGLHVRKERDELAGHEAGQDFVACYLHNGNEYIEAMLGSYQARAVPFNVNYRYVADELTYLLTDNRAKAVIYHSAFAPTLAAVRNRTPSLTTLLQVADESGHDLLPGARWYEEALAASTDTPPDVTTSPDDLYALYTGGTTGLPKGVLWRQADIFVAGMGGKHPVTGEEFSTLDDITERASRPNNVRQLPTPPFMHGAGQWALFASLAAGGTILLPDVVDRLDADSEWDIAERERATSMMIVGDSFARPLVESFDRRPRDVSSLRRIGSGGAILSAELKKQLMERCTNARVVDGLGSSETGAQAAQVSSSSDDARTAEFTPDPAMTVVDEARTEVLEPGHDGLGWLAQTGRIPLGYLGDPDKTARTFPLIDGRRMAVPGDRARVRADGTLELLGRDSVTINTGGEKVFAEEVEQAIIRHPAVADCVVCGRPSERWGNEVVAIVEFRPGASATDDELTTNAAQSLARYKLPKQVIAVDKLLRSPAGKVDYRWAKAVALGDTA